MLTAKEALEMTNEKGERLQLIKQQLEYISNNIVMACLDGKRQIRIQYQPLSEVLYKLHNLGYTTEPCYGCEQIIVRW